jgi:dUTP pyrophosphatase
VPSRLRRVTPTPAPDPASRQLMRIRRMHPGAVLPFKATSGAAGWDLCPVDYSWVGFESTKVPLGWAFEIPPGYKGILSLRSGAPEGLQLSSGIGLIDSDYRGELKARCRYLGRTLGIDGPEVDTSRELMLRPNCSYFQITFVHDPQFFLAEAEELNITDRGDGGFGSTGVER